MSQFPNPFGFQAGSWPPAQSSQPSSQAWSSYPPPPSNHNSPNPTRNSQFERGWPAQSLPNQPQFGGTYPSFPPPPPYVSRNQTMTSNADTTNKAERRSSFRSALGQLAKAAIFGDVGTTPFTASNTNSVIVNSVKLGQQDLWSLQAVLGPISPGSYWYDRRCGAYGNMGGPCIGFIVAGLDLGGGQLAPNASGHTGTRVFINGREIHATDVQALQGMGITVMPGNWWLTADGSYGYEGNPMPIGNARLQAAAAGGGGGGRGQGGAHTWSTNMGHFGGSDGQGFTYIGGPGWSYSN